MNNLTEGGIHFPPSLEINLNQVNMIFLSIITRTYVSSEDVNKII